MSTTGPRTPAWGGGPALRRIVTVGGFLLLASLIFLQAFVDAQSMIARVAFAVLGVLLAFSQAPTLSRLWPQRGNRRDGPTQTGPRTVADRDHPVGHSAGASGYPVAEPMRLRSRFRQRWPRLAGRLPGFRPRRPADLPERLATFRGRAGELAQLVARLQPPPTARGDAGFSGLFAPRRRRFGPPIVLIHGMPGVGKSALAQELGHRMARSYPHGQLYANLGSGGSSRPAGEVLKEFLVTLGWPEHEVPDDTDSRGKIFRSLTRHRRIMVVLDAARDLSQVRELLPSGRRQAVIITSRRDLGAEFSAGTLTLTPPTTEEGVEMLGAITDSTLRDAWIHAVAIVRRCGHLPRAIRGAGARVVADRDPFRTVAHRLWDPATDLMEYLTYGGATLRSGFEAEYERLLPREQQALRLLPLVASPTFTPWVLRPLLGGSDIGDAEAENLVTRLGAAHLLEVMGPGGRSSAARYRLPPLVRSLATTHWTTIDSKQLVAQASNRLQAAYRGVVLTILARRGEPVRPPSPQEAKWLPPEYVLDRIVDHPEWWVRAEHANLFMCVERPQPHDVDVCWRVARWLGDCLPAGLDPERIEAALTSSLVSANGQIGGAGEVGVRLARAGLLTASERYADAEQAATEAIELATGQGLPELAVVGHRRRAEAQLQIGSYLAAGSSLQAARQLAAPNGNGTGAAAGTGERELIGVLEQVCRGNSDPAHWRASPHPEPPTWHDVARFRAHLARAEATARRGQWTRSHQELRIVHDIYRDDAARAAAVEYADARLWLAQALVASVPATRVQAAQRSAQRAAEALLTYRESRNRIGQLRARCLLTRALTTYGDHPEATHQSEKARTDLRTVEPIAGASADLLHAMVDHASGQALLAAVTQPPFRRKGGGNLGGTEPRQVTEPVRLLEHAASIFQHHGDWWLVADCDLSLGRAYRYDDRNDAAMAALHRAADAFARADDEAGHRTAIGELISTARRMGRRGTARDLRRELGRHRDHGEASAAGAATPHLTDGGYR